MVMLSSAVGSVSPRCGTVMSLRFPPGLELEPENTSPKALTPAYIDFSQLCTWQARKTSPCRSSASTGAASDCDSLSEPPSPLPRNLTEVHVASHATLCEAFAALQHKDANCVLKLRKLQGLPEAGSEELLQRHFGLALAELHLVRAQAKGRRGGSDTKLSGLGFVVFRAAEDVEKALACGAQHSIAGVAVNLQRFEQARAP